jgi:glycosyltransferase involved in cell wall biosynthesis
MNLPKISIITPTFNASKTLKECIESVAIQNYFYLEHWIIDGLSTDNTLAIIQEYAQKYSHIKYISEKDKGIYDAMNKGIELATGDFLLFLGADDALSENILLNINNQVDFNNFDLIYGRVKYPDYECGREYKKEYLTNELKINPFIHLFMHHQGTFIRKKVFYEFGIYDLKYPIGADVHFFIKTINHSQIRKQFVDILIADVGEGGASGQIEELQLRADFPILANKYLKVEINQKNYYRNFAKYYFDEIANKNIIKGLKGIIKIMFVQRDFFYYLKNTFYHLKQRIKYK